MKKFIVFVCVILSSAQVFAATPSCTGKVQFVLDWPTKCGGRMAFKLEANTDKWICTLSEKSEAMLLLAYSAQKRVTARLDGSLSRDCSTLTDYHKPLYIYIRD